MTGELWWGEVEPTSGVGFEVEAVWVHGQDGTGLGPGVKIQFTYAGDRRAWMAVRSGQARRLAAMLVAAAERLEPELPPVCDDFLPVRAARA